MLPVPLGISPCILCVYEFQAWIYHSAVYMCVLLLGFPASAETHFFLSISLSLNRLKPNDPYMGRTAPLTSKRCILYIYSTNIGAEYFKHALYSPFSSLQNAVCFTMPTCLVPVLFTFYIPSVLKLRKNNSGAKGFGNRASSRCSVEITTKTNVLAQFVEALSYKPEGRGFDSRWCHWN